MEQGLQANIPAHSSSRMSRAYLRCVGYPEEVVERAQVLHYDLALKGGDRALKECSIGRREHNVVDTEKVGGVIILSMVEQGHVRLGLEEAKGDQVGDEANVPSPRYLLEVVQRAIQPVD